MKKHRWLQNLNPVEILKQDFNEERVGIWVENFKEIYWLRCKIVFPIPSQKREEEKNLCFPPK